MLSSKLVLQRLNEMQERDYSLQFLLGPVGKKYRDKLPNLLNIAFDARLFGAEKTRFGVWGSYTRSEYNYTYVVDYIPDSATSAADAQSKIATGVRSDLRISGSFQHLLDTQSSQLGFFGRMGVAVFNSNWDVERGTTVKTLSQLDGPALLATIGISRAPRVQDNGAVVELDADYFHGAKVSGKSINATAGWRFVFSKEHKSESTVSSLLDLITRIQLGTFRASHPLDDQTNDLKNNNASFGLRVQLR
ncbi:MAG: hypothetical protein ACO3A4_13610 [Silvanigrellaceae bacterium]